MKIALFGGTGGSGLQLIKQGLQAGHHLKVLLRKPSKLKIENKNLEIIKGDVLNIDDVEKAIIDTDLILSALGVKGLGTTTLYSDSIANIISAAESNKVSRIMCITAAGVGVKDESRSPSFPHWQRIFGKIFADMEQMEILLQNSSLNWTVMKPPGLTNSKFTGEYRTNFGDFMTDGSQISRADLAHCILSHIDDKTFFKKKVALSY